MGNNSGGIKKIEWANPYYIREHGTFNGGAEFQLWMKFEEMMVMVDRFPSRILAEHAKTARYEEYARRMQERYEEVAIEEALKKGDRNPSAPRIKERVVGDREYPSFKKLVYDFGGSEYHFRVPKADVQAYVKEMTEEYEATRKRLNDGGSDDLPPLTQGEIDKRVLKHWQKVARDAWTSMSDNELVYGHR